MVRIHLFIFDEIINGRQHLAMTCDCVTLFGVGCVQKSRVFKTRQFLLEAILIFFVEVCISFLS